MKKRRLLALVNLISDGVLIGAALLSLSITLMDFLGLFEGSNWISKRIDALILLGLSFLLINSVVERRGQIIAIQKMLDNIMSAYTWGVQYLEDTQAVEQELERLVRQSEETIMALGARSRATDYLLEIESAVLQRDILYYRLLDGTYITHELHAHLQKLVHMPNVRISWTPNEKFGHMTVTEQGCIIVFPAAHRNKLSGLKLPGEVNSRRYTQYFMDAFSESYSISTEFAIALLCKECSPSTAGKAEEIQRFLERDRKVSSE